MSATNESYLKVFITAAKKSCLGTRAFNMNVLLTEVCKGNKNLAGWFRAFFRFPHNKRWLEDVCHIILLGKGLFIELKFTELSKIQIRASSEHPGSSGLKNLQDVYVGAVMEMGGRGEGEDEAEQQQQQPLQQEQYQQQQYQQQQYHQQQQQRREQDDDDDDESEDEDNNEDNDQDDDEGGVGVRKACERKRFCDHFDV
jgi:hypothetical protein